MTKTSKIFATACIAAVAHAQYPSLQVEVDGVEQTLYVQYPNWSEAATSGADLSFDFNNRMYLSTKSSLDTSAYFMPSLVGGSMEFDVNLSQSGCGCITALYAIVMPASANNSDPFQYCDAASVGGYMCPEFDMMEANMYAWRTTAHKCDYNGSSYSNCDRNGTCSSDILLDQPIGVFAPGSTSGIDTTRTFHMKQDFHESDGEFTGYTTTLTQDDKEVVLQQSNCDYLNYMSTDMTKMVISISNWGSDGLDWLQHGACTGSCSRTNTFSTLSNLQFNTNGDYTPNPEPPTPEPTEYAYGGNCNAVTDQDCGLVDCKVCSWSWPIDDPATWASDDALCRCQVLNDEAEFIYGDDCWETDAMDCNQAECLQCSWSYPVNDPRTWDSSDAKCRCQVAQEISYGEDCGTLDSQDCANVDCQQCSWSWPTNDPRKWDSSDALCRCQVEKEPVVYNYGQDCGTLDSQDCANVDCQQCSWSWPAADPRKWDSSDALCRCQVEAEPEYTYGNECENGSLDSQDCGNVDCAVCKWSWPKNDPRQWSSSDALCRCEVEKEPEQELVIYKYGNKCGANLDQTECGDYCENCQKSWPADDPDKWSSPDAACRCLPKQRAPHGYTYGKSVSANKNNGICNGCDDCRWSWPSDSSDKWKSAEAMFRCKPEDIVFQYSGSCGGLYDLDCGADCHDCQWGWPADDPDSWNSVDATCHCPVSEIREVFWGGECASLTDGLCGTYCTECRWSWEADDFNNDDVTIQQDSAAVCRCRNWW